MSSEEQLLSHYKDKLKTITEWEELTRALERGEINDAVKKFCPELAKRLAENEKLRYRVGIMKRALEQQAVSGAKPSQQAAPSDAKSSKKTTDGKKQTDPKKSAESKKPAAATVEPEPNSYVVVKNYGDSILEKLNFIVEEAVKKLFPKVGLACTVREVAQKKFGDYQFNMSTQISRRLAELGESVSPTDVAKRIADAIQNPLVAKVEAVTHFVNIFLDSDYINKRIADVFLNGTKLPTLEQRRVVVDFSSPNIAKQMHVGHLRSTIIGESICRLLELVHFNVLRLNHVGDWGTQFGMLIAHLQDCFPNYSTETPPIQDLQKFYKESKKRFDEDAAFKVRAYECVVKLQNFEPKIKRAWELICDVSRRDFERLYQRLDISVEERGESFYQQRMVDLVADLGDKLQVDDGRKIYFPVGCTIPLTIVKSDGSFTYDTSDLATLRQRLVEEKANWCLYVVDAGQSEHFETIYAAARELGWYNPIKSRIEHVQFGLVLGEDKKKFKTRSGDTVKLTDLLDEGVRRADAKLREKGRDKELTEAEFEKAKEAVAYGCIKYVDLSHVRTSDYVFSYDKMLDDRGNTAVYLLYAYARIKAIARNAQITEQEITDYVKQLGGAPLPLTHEREFKLAKQILKFSDCLLHVIKTMHLHKLCDYIYNLATTFHDFYGECYVVHKTADGDIEIDFHRLVLCEVTAKVMSQCFDLLGLRTVQKM